MEPIISHRCLVCQTITGEKRPDGKEDWNWLSLGHGNAGPFCSATCAAAWLAWPDEAQLVALFGSAALAFHLVAVAYRCKHDPEHTTPAFSGHKERFLEPL